MTTHWQRATQANHWLANGLLLLVAFLWGSSYGVAKEALAFVPVLLFLCIRFGMTWLLGLPLVWRDWLQLDQTTKCQTLLLGTLLLATISAETYSLLTLDAGLAAVLISTCLLITPMIEQIIQRSWLPKRLLLASVASFIGVMLIALRSDLKFDLTLGFGLILLAALLRSFLVICTGKLARRVAPLTLSTSQAGVVFAGTLVASLVLIEQGQRQLPSELSFWWPMVYLVTGCTFFAFGATNHALKSVSASQASLLMGLEPVFGMLFGAVWLQEQFTFIQWLGASIMFGATYSVLARRTP